MVEMQEEETGKVEIFICSFKIKTRDLNHIKSLICTLFQFIIGLTRSETNLVNRLSNN